MDETNPTNPMEPVNPVPSGTTAPAANVPAPASSAVVPPELPTPGLTSTMQAKRNKKLMLIVAGVIVFLLVLLISLFALNSNRNNNQSAPNTNDTEQDEIVDEDTAADENDEIPEVDEDEDVTVDVPELTQECVDNVKGIKFGMPAGWTCFPSDESLTGSSFAIRASESNDSTQLSSSDINFYISNLGRGAYCSPGIGIDTSGCSNEPFYENPNMTLSYFNSAQGGEIFGFVNLKNYENEYISITGPRIGKNQEIPEEDKNLFIAMLETIRTFPVNSSTEKTTVEFPVNFGGALVGTWEFEVDVLKGSVKTSDEDGTTQTHVGGAPGP